MQEKFYNHDYSHQKHAMDGNWSSGYSIINKQSIIKNLVHPGFYGRNHADMRGHCGWNRKGKW